MSDPIRNILEKQLDGATKFLNKKLKYIEKLEAENKELKELLYGTSSIPKETIDEMLKDTKWKNDISQSR